MKKLLVVLVAGLVLLGLAVTVSAYDVPPTLQGRAIHNPDGSWVLVGPHWTGGVVQLWDEDAGHWVNLTDPAGGLVYQVALDFGPDSYNPKAFVDGLEMGYTTCLNEKGEPFAPADDRPDWPYTRYWANGTPYPGQQMDIKGKVTFILPGDGSYLAEMDVYQVRYFDAINGTDRQIDWDSSTDYWWRNPGKPPWAKNDKNMNQCWQPAP